MFPQGEKNTQEVCLAGTDSDGNPVECEGSCEAVNLEGRLRVPQTRAGKITCLLPRISEGELSLWIRMSLQSTAWLSPLLPSMS